MYWQASPVAVQKCSKKYPMCVPEFDQHLFVTLIPIVLIIITAITLITMITIIMQINNTNL